MGPRLIGRGNLRGQAMGYIRTFRFNGAAADRPRKPRCTAGRAFPTTRFNGAAADRPRKRHCGRGWTTGLDGLQWGPRLIGRGNAIFGKMGQLKKLALQWGRG